MSYLIISSALMAMLAYGAVVIGCIVFYVKNIIKLVSDIKLEIYTPKTWLRVAGIFFPILGIVMGFV